MTLKLRKNALKFLPICRNPSPTRLTKIKKSVRGLTNLPKNWLPLINFPVPALRNASATASKNPVIGRNNALTLVLSPFLNAVILLPNALSVRAVNSLKLSTIPATIPATSPVIANRIAPTIPRKPNPPASLLISPILDEKSLPDTFLFSSRLSSASSRSSAFKESKYLLKVLLSDINCLVFSLVSERVISFSSRTTSIRCPMVASAI